MPNERNAEIEAACIGVTMRFFRALDTREHQTAAALMAADGVWDRQGKLLSGRAAILEALEQRPDNRATAHILTNMTVEIAAPDRARVTFYLTAYEGEVAADGGAAPPPVARLAGIRVGTDEMVLLPGEGWRIKEKRSQALFRGA